MDGNGLSKDVSLAKRKETVITICKRFADKGTPSSVVPAFYCTTDITSDAVNALIDPLISKG